MRNSKYRKQREKSSSRYKIKKANNGVVFPEKIAPAGGIGVATGGLKTGGEFARIASSTGNPAITAGAAVLGTGLGLFGAARDRKETIAENDRITRMEDAREDHGGFAVDPKFQQSKDMAKLGLFKKNKGLVEIEGKNGVGELHFSASDALKNVGVEPHSKGSDKEKKKRGDVVQATEGDWVAPVQGDKEAQEEILALADKASGGDPNAKAMLERYKKTLPQGEEVESKGKYSKYKTGGVIDPPTADDIKIKKDRETENSKPAVTETGASVYHQGKKLNIGEWKELYAMQKSLGVSSSSVIDNVPNGIAKNSEGSPVTTDAGVPMTSNEAVDVAYKEIHQDEAKREREGHNDLTDNFYGEAPRSEDIPTSNASDNFAVALGDKKSKPSSNGELTPEQQTLLRSIESGSYGGNEADLRADAEKTGLDWTRMKNEVLNYTEGHEVADLGAGSTDASSNWGKKTTAFATRNMGPAQDGDNFAAESEGMKLVKEEKVVDYTKEMTVDETLATTEQEDAEDEAEYSKRKGKGLGNANDLLRYGDSASGLLDTLGEPETYDKSTLNLPRYKYNDMSNPRMKEAAKADTMRRYNRRNMVASQGQHNALAAQDEVLAQESKDKIIDSEIARQQGIDHLNTGQREKEVMFDSQESLRKKQFDSSSRDARDNMRRDYSAQGQDVYDTLQQEGYMKNRDATLDARDELLMNIMQKDQTSLYDYRRGKDGSLTGDIDFKGTPEEQALEIERKKLAKAKKTTPLVTPSSAVK